MKICKSFFSKFRGLMFSKKKDLLFVFENEKRRSIHMLFVFFPINVIFLDSNYVIKEVKKLYPFTFYLSNCKSKYILESPFPIDLKIGEKLDIMKYND